MNPRRLLFVILAALTSLAFVPSQASAEETVLQLPIRTDGPKSLDPVQGSTTYDNMACVQMYETLLVNQYADPFKIEPLLLAEMPTTQDEGKTWRFRLKPGVKFHDNPCFEGGVGRNVTTDDVFYSIKRVVDKNNGLKNVWLLENTILGFDEYAEKQNASERFDYDAPVAGFRKINGLEFEIELTKPVYRFLYILSMFQTSIVPREAVEYYGKDFSFNAVGTGPFMLRDPSDWVPKRSLTVYRNPDYHEVFYPARDQWSREDMRNRLHRAAGQQVPFADRIEFTMFVEDQPMWLQFRAGNIGYVEVPAEYFEEAFDKRTKELRPEFERQGIRAHSNELLDFIFRAFNMLDPVVGGYTPDKIALRKAMAYAVDLQEISDVFYNNTVIVYDGPIPPQLDGHPEGHRVEGAPRGPDLDKARELLAEAGYPNGEGLPPIKFFANRGGNTPEQTELMKRQLARIGVQLDPQLVDFSTLIEATNNRKAPMFSFAWSSDYPDGENNLALFYSPNKAPGSNHSNYERPEFDRLYEKILTMGPSPERTAIYEQMRDMVIDDVPYIGSLARERFYLINPWLVNCKPTERYWGWFKYLDVDESKRP